jgi:hypothetical protein
MLVGKSNAPEEGRELPQETKDKLSIALKTSEAAIKARAKMTGKPIPEERRAHIRAALRERREQEKGQS